MSRRRPASKSASRTTEAPLRPGVERRRRRRRERRQDRLIQLWRLLWFSGAAGGLGWVLLSQGWVLRSPQQLQVSGSERLGVEAVSQAAGMRFPQPLLGLDPHAMEQTLMRELPVQSAAVRRRLLPPGLDVELDDRRPMAAASRTGPRGVERGMVDRRGQWMPATMAARGDKPETSIEIQGWIPSQRDAIALLLENRAQLGGTLQRVLFSPEGGISLQVTGLGLVHLGSDPGLMQQQMVMMAQLSRSLPAHLRQQQGSSLDLSDPSRPELQLNKKAPTDSKP
ncbi:cell division protein FtsQ/DivIB [Synechococcus sp. HK01-R]|uniref:cell division protein FtsQ/DivIB n=1 Tax=Synechococcus sp. HK01-R TaxID=2751171 RepID=UPI00162969B9|nr:FtsQ-type POTRA domain-containing protein [Synechococcus sp. HK01-R]QNG27050.1 FtsQ-type POTRA domain-containing protein [Synechococcus sp. HK01-R]